MRALDVTANPISPRQFHGCAKRRRRVGRFRLRTKPRFVRGNDPPDFGTRKPQGFANTFSTPNDLVLSDGHQLAAEPASILKNEGLPITFENGGRIWLRGLTPFGRDFPHDPIAK
jgi:hypothetical protein